MEEIIRVIVDADKSARNAVKNKQQERHNIQNLIQEQNKAIKEKYQEETTQCIAQKRTALDAELDSQMQQEQREFEEALQNLQQKYDEHKQVWVKEIVDRCLAS